MLRTILLTSRTRYSRGVSQLGFLFIIISVHLVMLLGSQPLRMLLPTSMVSGLSVTSLNVTLGTLKMQHSSWTVPESVRTQRAFISNLMKSNRPKGRCKMMRLSSTRPKQSNFCLVRGCKLHTNGRSCCSHNALNASTKFLNLNSTSTFSALCKVTRRYLALFNPKSSTMLLDSILSRKCSITSKMGFPVTKILSGGIPSRSSLNRLCSV
jgi:hypothetical protein